MKWIGWLAVMIALLCLSGFLGANSRTNHPAVRSLPDGSILKLGGTSYGLGHTFSLNAANSWRARVGKYLPKAWLLRLGWLPFQGAMVIGSPPGCPVPNLAIFTVCLPANPGSFGEMRAVLVDDHGSLFDAGGTDASLVSSYSKDAKDALRLDTWNLTAFPRRGKNLLFRCFQFSKARTKWEPVAEFDVPNPTPGPYPQWRPEPLPSTKQDGDLSVTLQSLSCRVLDIGSIVPTVGEEISRTYADFRLVQAGRTNQTWRPVNVEISDATGNHWTPWDYIASPKPRNGLAELIFRGALWRGETAWKLRYEFSRTTGFEPDEIFTFSGVEVPGPDQVITLDNATVVDGTKVQLIAVSGEAAEQPDRLKHFAMTNSANISISVRLMPRDKRLSLVRIVDQNGREAKVAVGADVKYPERVFGFRPAEGARQLSFTFALHKSRYVDFLARPQFVDRSRPLDISGFR